MSANEDKLFAAEIAKQGRAECKKCKQKCLQGDLRIAKVVPNAFGSGKMKSWYHLDCLIELFHKQRATTKRIDDSSDIEGWDKLSKEHQDLILGKISECQNKFGRKLPQNKPSNEDNLFERFIKLVEDVRKAGTSREKTSLVQNLFEKGSDDTGFKGNKLLWCQLLLPRDIKRVYNLQDKQLINLFSKLFHTDHESMLMRLEQVDIGDTIHKFFTKSKYIKPAEKGLLTIQEVDDFLEKLTQLTKEDDQLTHFKQFVSKCTSAHLKMVIQLISHDLAMKAGPKCILNAIHPDAFQAFQTSRDLKSILDRCSIDNSSSVKATVNIMTPIQPMLALSCKSVEQAMKACPNGMYSEIKYDGERVQVHKQGSEFKYFSRHLKPVMPHKVNHLKDYIVQAFPNAEELIFDSEILMIDTKTGHPLPFGTLGIHKRKEFRDANVCLFVFDCIYYNGQSLIDKSITDRKKILRENMTEIPNRILFSEMNEIYNRHDLKVMIAKVLSAGLEGLVLKDLKSIYAPGKRGWLKVKKDYLFDGAIADTADLIVLGGWKSEGSMSSCLMGSYNTETKKFCTVTKVSYGVNNDILENMTYIGRDTSKIPNWLNCPKGMTPSYIAEDPKKQPVWDIMGAEFTKNDHHTADGISIRFPRVFRIRNDKNWKSATTVQELNELYRISKESPDVSLLINAGEISLSGPSRQNSNKLDSSKRNLATGKTYTGSKRAKSDEISDEES